MQSSSISTGCHTGQGLQRSGAAVAFFLGEGRWQGALPLNTRNQRAQQSCPVFSCCFSQEASRLTSFISLSINSAPGANGPQTPQIPGSKATLSIYSDPRVDQGCLSSGSFSQRAQASSRPLNEPSQHSH